VVSGVSCVFFFFFSLISFVFIVLLVLFVFFFIAGESDHTIDIQKTVII